MPVQKPKTIDQMAGPEILGEITKEQTKPEEQEKTYAHVEEDPDFETFVQIAKMTGSLIQDYQTLELEDKKKFQVGFNQWKKAGKPKPNMPQFESGKVEYPIDIWIARVRGETVYYYDTNFGRKIGCKEKDGKIRDYTLKYSVEALTKLIKERDELTPVDQNRNQYVVVNNQVHVIGEEDLLKSYDKLAELVKTGKITA